MPRGDKSSYTNKQKRQAEHIEEGYEERGIPEKEAERRAWATVNKQDHGGKKSGSGVDVPRTPPRRTKADVSVVGPPQTAHRLKDPALRRRSPLRVGLEGAEQGNADAGNGLARIHVDCHGGRLIAPQLSTELKNEIDDGREHDRHEPGHSCIGARDEPDRSAALAAGTNCTGRTGPG
jgi:hypothetical protein